MRQMRRVMGALTVCCICSAVRADEQNGNKGREPPLEPFQFTARADWTGTTRAMSDSFQVPSGKRLVIENVSASVELPADQQVLSAVVATVAGDERVIHYIHVPKSATFDPDVDNMSPGGGQDIPNNSLDIYSGAQPLRLYADPGSVVDVGVWRNDPTCRNPCGTAIVAISGYLVDVKAARATP